MTGTIIGYQGDTTNYTTLSIPDTIQGTLNGESKIINITAIFTFVAPETRNYTFKLWGASGGQAYDEYVDGIASQCGLGGYSEGTITLEKGENIYCYIGGKGLYGSTNIEDGSGGYNGGGSGLKSNNFYGFAGGGSTDIRYGGTKVTQYGEDYGILVAGGWNDDGSAKGAIYLDGQRNVMKYFGQGASITGSTNDLLNDHAGGGGGYYGGEDSVHCNGGGAGGSAYADLDGIIKKVTNIKGYSGLENGDGAEMLGKFGNGKIIISQY